MTAPTLGVVLAGGLSRRMGGGDKTLRLLGGRTLLSRVLARLSPQTSGLLLNANGDPARFAGYGVPVVRDGLPGHPGPLAGVLAGLDWAAAEAPGVAWVVTVPGDAPFPPADLVARLHAGRLAAGTALACATSGGRAHPVVGLWPVALREALRRAVAEDGVRAVRAFTAGGGVAEVAWEVGGVDPFLNVNTEAELAEAERGLLD